jgi:hypothetical protein
MQLEGVILTQAAFDDFRFGAIATAPRDRLGIEFDSDILGRLCLNKYTHNGSS